MPVVYFILGFCIFSSVLHLALFFAHKSFKENFYYSLILISLVLFFLTNVYYHYFDLKINTRHILNMIIYITDSVLLALFNYSVFDLKKIKNYLIISISIITIFIFPSIYYLLIIKNHFISLMIFFIPYFLNIIIFLILFIFQFFKTRQFLDLQKTIIFSGVIINIPIMMPVIYKWGYGVAVSPKVIIGILPFLICFEISLIIQYKKGISIIKHLENEIYKKSFNPILENICNQYKLTGREKEIVKLLITGKEAKEISKELSISYNTVRVFKQKIYEKMKVKNIAELILIFSGK